MRDYIQNNQELNAAYIDAIDVRVDRIASMTKTKLDGLHLSNVPSLPGSVCYSCFSSPLRRAATTADIIWEGREQPLIHLDELKEADLGCLQGMKNGAMPLICIAWKEVGYY